MNEMKYLLRDQPSGSTKSFVIEKTKISGPVFIPEIKSEEDIEVLLRFSNVLSPNNPILVPANKWMTQLANPHFHHPDVLRGMVSVAQLIKEHPIMFYEPPEFFRYTMPKQLITYAFKSNRKTSQQFYAFLKKGDEERAFNLVPAFFKPFLNRQMASLYEDSKIKIPEGRGDDEKHIERGWLEVSKSYVEHMTEIILYALKMPTSTIIPTVPPLLKSSDQAYIPRIEATNRLTSILCKKYSEESEKDLKCYFHMYVDSSTLQQGTGNSAKTITDILEIGLDKGDYCGVALTFTGYETMAKSGGMIKVEHLINEVVNICHTHQIPLPVFLPRSGWYGLYLTDYDIQAFGGLFNGKPVYLRGGGIRNEDDKYGKTPLIDHGIELSRRDVANFINQHNEFPKVDGLPKRPEIAVVNDPKKYRISFSKPMRLIHSEEARRVRIAKSQGAQSPAKRYFEHTEHPLLGGRV